MLAIGDLSDDQQMIEPQTFNADADLEGRIARQAKLIHSAPTRAGRLAAAEELRRLHAMRSPERIAAMEREAGIR